MNEIIDWEAMPDADYYVPSSLYGSAFWLKLDENCSLHKAKFSHVRSYDKGWHSWEDSKMSVKEKALEVAIPRPLQMEDDDLQIPDWAIGENRHHYLVPGAQLCTKDGRNTGNAHIIMTIEKHYDGDDKKTVIYECLTDAGNKISCTEKEIHSMFYVGDYISAVGRILKDFDRNKQFEVYPHI